MRIYGHMLKTGYEMLHTADERWENLNKLNEKPAGKKWKPIRVRRVRPTMRAGCRPSDSPFCGSDSLILRRSAVDALSDILDAHGELLPLIDEEGIELWAYHPRSIDAYDHALTRGWRDKKGRIELAEFHVFVPSVVEGVDIFKQAAPRAGRIYFGENFLQRWKQAKLKGLDFKLAWDSDLPPDQQPNIWKSKPVKL
jgi:hypothetical protein